jgi:hypothetical protein
MYLGCVQAIHIFKDAPLLAWNQLLRAARMPGFRAKYGRARLRFAKGSRDVAVDRQLALLQIVEAVEKIAND